MRTKAFGSQAKLAADLEFLQTYDLHNFKAEAGRNTRLEASVQKGGTVAASETPLNPDDAWDQKEYGPLSDINPS